MPHPPEDAGHKPLTGGSGRADALILAAGRATRMGALKPLLTIDGKTLLERVIHLFQGIGISPLVVVGFAAERLIPLIEATGAVWVLNEGFDRGMFSSVQTGVRCLAPSGLPFFVLPVDCPCVQPTTLLTLLAAYEEGGDAVVRPVYGGQRGHPPLLSSSLKKGIMEYHGEGGLRAFLTRYADKMRSVACDDPGVLMDLDTPAQYAAVKTPS